MKKERISVYQIQDDYTLFGYFAKGFVNRLKFAERIIDEFEEKIDIEKVEHRYLRIVPDKELGSCLIKSEKGKGAFKATVIYL